MKDNIEVINAAVITPATNQEFFIPVVIWKSCRSWCALGVYEVLLDAEAAIRNSSMPVKSARIVRVILPVGNVEEI